LLTLYITPVFYVYMERVRSYTRKAAEPAPEPEVLLQTR